MKNISVIITVFNRIDKTLICLEKLYISFDAINKSNDYNLDIFLTDDGSTDGSSQILKDKFPKINIINGNGNLFWNKGMLLAWQASNKQRASDFYFWLNNDTFLFESAFKQFLIDYNNYKHFFKKKTIVAGACCEKMGTSEFSYGLRNNNKKIIPNGQIQEGNMMNGNAVLIPKDIFDEVGYLSPDYTHAMGDYDYGLRAIKAGYTLITTSNYIAVCETNKEIPSWRNPELNLIKRCRALHSPLGLNINEYKIFKKKYSKKNYYLGIFKIYLQCVFPKLTSKFKKND